MCNVYRYALLVYWDKKKLGYRDLKTNAIRTIVPNMCYDKKDTAVSIRQDPYYCETVPAYFLL